VALNTVPPVTFWPAIIFSLTGFQILLPLGASNAGPYFQLSGLSAPLILRPWRRRGLRVAVLACRSRQRERRRLSLREECRGAEDEGYQRAEANACHHTLHF
jgi:hypothetical protein